MGAGFLSTLSLRRATGFAVGSWPRVIFLSTLSLRRATAFSGFLVGCINNFYPRSPCGERQANAVDQILPGHISIHALLAESDGGFAVGSWPHVIFLSTLSLRRATLLLALLICPPRDFYPRSPCGERPPVRDIIQWEGIFLSTLSLRRATVFLWWGVRKAVDFYPRSPCGERLHLFASNGVDFAISIHALLAESDAPLR